MNLFFDTSALVRRYDLTEPGSDRVLRLCQARSGNRIALLTLTSIEMASALRRKLREHAIDPTQHHRMWQMYTEHRRRQYELVELDQPIYRGAQRLLARHPLRAYDAMQLAGALRFARTLPRATELRFCTADRGQALAATAEGLPFEFIA